MKKREVVLGVLGGLAIVVAVYIASFAFGVLVIDPILRGVQQ